MPDTVVMSTLDQLPFHSKEQVHDARTFLVTQQVESMVKTVFTQQRLWQLLDYLGQELTDYNSSLLYHIRLEAICLGLPLKMIWKLLLVQNIMASDVTGFCGLIFKIFKMLNVIHRTILLNFSSKHEFCTSVLL